MPKTALSPLILTLGVLLVGAPAGAQNPICASLSPNSPAYSIYGCASADEEGQEEILTKLDEVLDRLTWERVNAKGAWFFSAGEPGEQGAETVIQAPAGTTLLLSCFYDIRLAGQPTVAITLRADPGQNLLADVLGTDTQGNFTTLTTRLVYANTGTATSGAAIVECTGLAIPTS